MRLLGLYQIHQKAIFMPWLLMVGNSLLQEIKLSDLWIGDRFVHRSGVFRVSVQSTKSSTSPIQRFYFFSHIIY